jgi:hypothetical protein
LLFVAPIILPMKHTASLFPARYLSLILLVGALVQHATFSVDHGSAPGTSGLVRFSRDLHRRANGVLPNQGFGKERSFNIVLST